MTTTEQHLNAYRFHVVSAEQVEVVEERVRAAGYPDTARLLAQLADSDRALAAQSLAAAAAQALSDRVPPAS